MNAYGNTGVGADAGAGNDDDLAGFEKRVGDPLQKSILGGGDLGGGHSERVLESAHWTGSGVAC
ncbi:hypothetical protein CTA1_10078 [Colletotrichum tanaceti]|uniref:Uncharacterized protein n=1 Tax=Colletotrichum tanaceti TaxID=1306861 RepID=A0A4U6X948_9PEZI|nr:hypothetical protein CTA1_10078 [Colletotrichum tanaceti]